MAKIKDLALELMNYEEGQLTEDEVIELFAYLIESGLAWTLQGHYGRTASDFIDNGYIAPDGQIIEQF